METNQTKDESIRILRLFKEGKLTEDQASELLDIATKSNKDEAEFDKNSDKKMGREISFDLNADNVGNFFKSIWKGPFSFSKSGNGNDINMSQFEDPTGSEFEFSDNHFSVSSSTALFLEHSKMVDNSVQASRITDIKLNHAKFCGNEIHGASLSHVQLNQSDLLDNEFHGSKLSKLNIEQNSKCSNSEFHGITAKGMSLLSESAIKDSEFHGCAFTNLTFTKTALKDCELHGVQLTDVSFENCNVKDIVFKDFQVRKTEFIDCEFKNVVFQHIDLDGRRYKGMKIADAKFKSTREFLEIAKPFEIVT